MKLNWKQISVALVLGAILGALGTTQCPLFGPHGFGRNPEKMHHHMMAQFTSKLQLTPDQQQKVSAILEDTRTRITALRGETRPKFEAIRASTKARIRELLTPEQQKKFDLMTAKMEARMEKRRGEWVKK